MSGTIPKCTIRINYITSIDYIKMMNKLHDEKLCSRVRWHNINAIIIKPRVKWRIDIRFTITNDEHQGYSPI